MARLHLFNPENDIALGAGTANFTAPKAAVALRNAGAALPLWYADDDDRILCYGLNERWLDTQKRRFNLGCDVFDHSSHASLTPAPWGWSQAVRREYADEGFTSDNLPSDADLDCWRKLSHRRTASLLREAIAPKLDFEIAPPAVEISDPKKLRSWLTDHPRSIIKSPWSSSGRGLTDTRHVRADEVIRRCEGIMRRQGSVMVENAYERTGDFAILFRCENGVCRHAGYSLFTTDSSGNYTGNLLADDPTLLDEIGRLYPPERISEVARVMTQALGALIAPFYTGPLGVDMLTATAKDGSILLDATVEVNLRMTMGFVAHSLSERFLAKCSSGLFRTSPAFNSQTPAEDDVVIDDRRIVSGRMMLTPPGGQFRFELEAFRR